MQGRAAVNALVEKEGGYIKNAFFRKEIGHIDIFWGDDTVGLKHIIKRRKERGQDVEAVINNISAVLNNGTIKREKRPFDNPLRDPREKRFKITQNGFGLIVATMLRGNKLNYVVTSFVDN